MKQVFPMDSRVTYDAEGRPSYDRAVSSKPLRSLIRKLFTTGVMPNPSDTCQVKAGGDGMTLIVNPGLAVLEGGLYLEDAARTLSVTAADPTFDRIDTVVLRWNENDSVRDCDLHIVAGVPARNPVRPALNREGSIYEIGLADIFVTKGVVTITNEKITDTRMESARCGIVSSVSKWDTTTIYQQIQGELAKFKSDEEVAFANWFDYMKGQLTEDAAGKLQTEVDGIRGQICTNLLNPTAQTETINGVTFTNNGDGTYTLNGTASDVTYLTLQDVKLKKGTYKLTGKQPGTTQDANAYIYTLDYKFSSNGLTDTVGTIDTDNYNQLLYMRVASGTTLTNEVVKPMLTTDLNATYDDFVPYTGDSGRLNEDVSALFDVIRPVGSLYPTTDASFDPNTAKGWHGKWERITDCLIYAAGTSDTIGAIVGSNTHTLTEAELPSHRHSIPSLSGSATGGDHKHKVGNSVWTQTGGYGSINPSGSGGANMANVMGVADLIVNSGDLSMSVTTNASNTGYTGSGTAIDMRPRRLNSIVWRRTA